MIAQHSIGHGHFGGERLQRIKALVCIVYSGLQLLVLALEGFLVVAQGVVVSDLPKHPRVRADGRGYGYRADERENRKTMQQVCGYDKLLQLAGRRSNIERIVLAR